MVKARIPKFKKLELYELVESETITIKEAAKMLGMNYSSAKSVVSSFRKRKDQGCLSRPSADSKDREDLLTAEVAILSGQSPIEVVCLIDGEKLQKLRQAAIKFL